MTKQHVHGFKQGSGIFYLFIGHHSFTQGNLQSEKITTLTVEEEETWEELIWAKFYVGQVGFGPSYTYVICTFVVLV